MDGCRPGCSRGEARNKADNPVGIMITVLLRSGDTISFPLKTPDPGLLTQSFFLSPERRRDSSAVTTWANHNNRQTPGIRHVYGAAVTRSDDGVDKRRRAAGRHVGETKPKGCCPHPCMPNEHETWLIARRLSITAAESRPLTGCDLDRWMARHVLFVAEKVGQPCGTSPRALES